MMSFREFVNRQNIQEGVFRAGAVSGYAAKSRKSSLAALDAYRHGKKVLAHRSSGDDVRVRLDRLEAAIDAMLDVLNALRAQIGEGIAVSVAGHLVRRRGSS